MATIISRITTQKKNKSRYNIYIKDGQQDSYYGSVDEDVLIRFGLRKGMELDKETLREIKDADTFHQSYALAIRYLSYRMRSVKEMRDYLHEKEVDDPVIRRIVDRLLQEGYLDDEQFAKAFVQTRINTSSKGPQLIKRELMEKGITVTNVDNALALYTEDLELKKAKKWAEKKMNSGGKHSYRKQIERLRANLMQKGFTQGTIQVVVQSLANEKDDTAEWEALRHQGEKIVRKYEKKYTGMELEQKTIQALYRKGFPIDLIQQFLDEQKMEENM